MDGYELLLQASAGVLASGGEEMTEQPVRVVVDQRELRSGVAKELERIGVDIHLATLEVGDYVVSDRVAFERKDLSDLLNSWIHDKKLFGQIGDLAHSYERPVLIIEGGDPFSSGRQIHPAAIQGMLNTIATSFRCPTLYSLNPAETARIIHMIGKREQSDERRVISLHGKRSHLSPAAQREYVVSAINDVGPQQAKNLLKHFGSVEKVMTASLEELTEVELVGHGTASKIRELVGGTYFGK